MTFEQVALKVKIGELEALKLFVGDPEKKLKMELTAHSAGKENTVYWRQTVFVPVETFMPALDTLIDNLTEQLKDAT